MIVPTLYLVDDGAVRNLEAFVMAGGTALVTYFSGIVDENDHVRLGGYPGAFRDLLDVRVEVLPARTRSEVQLDDGTSGDLWTEWLHLTGAKAIASYVDGPLPGLPAVTENTYGKGTAYYVATPLGRCRHRCSRHPKPRTGRCLARCGRAPWCRGGTPPRQRSSWLFVLNHTGKRSKFRLRAENSPERRIARAQSPYRPAVSRWCVKGTRDHTRGATTGTDRGRGSAPRCGSRERLDSPVWRVRDDHPP